MKHSSITRAYEAVSLVRAFTASETTPITAVVQPASDLIVDGQRLSDIASLLVMLSPANWITSGTGPVAVSPPVITRITGGDLVPSSLAEEQEQTDDVRVEFTVSDGDDASLDVQIYYTVYPVATQATSGNVTLSLDLDTGVVSIPYGDLFEPIEANANWVTPSHITLDGAPDGISVGSGGVLVDTAVLAPQANTVFTVTASDMVSPPANTLRTATKTIDLSAQANVIAAIVQPAFVQGFDGGIALDDSNRDVVLSAGNYTGLINPTIQVRLRVDGSAAEILTHSWHEGEEAVLYVDIWNNGRVPADGAKDAGFQSAPLTVQDLLTLSATSGQALEITPNPNAPDTYPVNGVVANTRPLDSGLTVLDFKSAEMVLIQSPIFTADSGTALGDTTTYSPPTIVAPDGATVSITFDLLDGADDSVILSNQPVTNDYDQDVIAAMQGKSVIWRATFTATGLSTLVVDSDPLAIEAGAASYTQKTFNPGADGRLNGTLATGASKILFGAWVARPDADERLLDIDNDTRISINASGQVTFRVAKDNGATFINYTSTAVVPASGKVFVGGLFDVAADVGDVRVGGTVENLDGTSARTGTIGGGAFRAFDRTTGSRKFDTDFADVVLQMDGSTTLDDLYNGGVPPALTSLSADVMLGFTMTAADFNGATHLGTLPLTIDGGDETFLEVL